ncbi:MAG: TRAP transporter large permease subunit [Deltaproteobacteria bacterium]|nr:TRAP transporter large permease subunit [Deltaproteobacteria bacterium]
MEWWIALLLILGSLIFLMLLRIPIAFCFLIVNLVAVYLLWGITGPEQLILSFGESVARFVFLPIPLFILMGTVIFHSGLAPMIIDAADKWLGRLPGRLSLLAVTGGTVIATLSGLSMASVVILGTSLVPEMQKRGYKAPMSLGPLLGSGGLAIMIPPSSLAVLLGALGEISVGSILIAIIFPGLLMAVLYASYILIRCTLQPSIAPIYEVPTMSMAERIIPTLRYVLPIAVIIFLVVGVIFLGMATPSEAAATGAAGTFILAAIYGKMNWKIIKKAIHDALEASAMVLMILVGANAFSQVLAFSEASSGLVKFATGLPLSPMAMFVFMQLIVVILGMFLEPGSLMMVCIPLFMPIVRALGINDIWFAVATLLSIEMGMTTPPIGLNLFVMKGVAPSGTTMGSIYRAGIPFLGCDVAAMVLILVFPSLALWLPGLMR